MKNRRNYYRILQVQPDASFEVIRTSYHTLMQRLKMHPDLGGDHWNATLINEAYATLTHPGKRAAYDSLIKSFRVQRGEQTRAPLPLLPKLVSLPRLNDSRCPFCDARYQDREAQLPDSTCYRCDSPLFSATRHDAGGTTRRLLERIPRRLKVTCSEASRPELSFEALTEDVSLVGMRLSCPCELSPGQRLKIQCSFAEAVGDVIYVVAKFGVIWPRWQVGVHFLTLKFKQVRGVFLSTEV